MKKRKIFTLIIVCSAVLTLVIALILTIRSLQVKPDEIGKFIRRERATVVIDGPFVGNSCQYRVTYKNVDGEQTGTLSPRSFGGKLVRGGTVDADVEVYTGKCCPTVSDPKPSNCRRTEEIRIIKVYE